MFQMKHKPNTASALRLEPEARDARSGGVFAALLPLVPVLCGGAAGWTALFGTPQPWWLLFLGSAAVACGLLFLYGRRWGRFVLPGGILLTVLFGAVFHRAVAAGAGELANAVLAAWSRRTGRIYETFSGGNAAYAWVPLWFAALLLLCRAAAKGSLLPALPVLLPLAAAVLTGLMPAPVGAALLLGAVLLPQCGALRDNAVRLTAALLAAALGFGAAALGGSLPYTEWRAALRRDLHALRYDSTAASMPEGQLANLGPWKKSDAEALAVTMETPQKLYLRGAVYETYTGTAWEPLAAEDRAEASDLFYWLHADGFFGQSQRFSAAEAAGETAAQAVTVENLGAACKAHAYLPYGVSAAGLDAGAAGDIAMTADDAALASVSGTIADWYMLQRSLAEVQDTEAAQQYLALEEAYRAYVEEHDLQMTAASWSVLDRQLGGDEAPHALRDILTSIRDFLTEKLRYDESVYTLSGGGDFLAQVLERSGAGYSVQYATAAALMLRYYGVPSRYVEGYFLTADEAARLDAGETAVLTEKNAHAWAEYYLNGVGFVPFEVTPGYYEPEDIPGDEGGGGTSYAGNPAQYETARQPSETDQEAAPTAAFRAVWLLPVPVLLLLGLLILVLVRRGRLRRALRRIDEAEDRDAIALRYGYAVLLLRHLRGTPPAGGEEAAALNREALFSRHDMTADQRAAMDAYAAAVRTACHAEWGRLRTLRYRYLDCIDL